MLKMAVIGESETVPAFKAVGFDTFQVTPGEAEAVLKEKYHSGKYAVIFISETMAARMEELLTEYGKQSLPAITILPLGIKSEGLGLSRMKRTSIRATGTDIVSKLR